MPRWFSNLAIIPGAVATTPIQDLISGLQTDGIWTKLDRLWVFAQATQTDALLDLVASATATAINSPTFTANRGFTGNGSNMSIDTNFNPSTVGGQYARDNACFFAWSNTAGTDAGGLAGYGASDNVYLFPEYTDTKTYMSINNVGAQAGATGAGGQAGLWLSNRFVSSSYDTYVNGSSFASVTQSSLALLNFDFMALVGNSAYTSRQVCCLGFGTNLSGTDVSNLYSRLRTYMTAVGVP